MSEDPETDCIAHRARVLIHDEEYDELSMLLRQHPALVQWRDAKGQTLLDATTSYAMDCSEPERERTYTRPAAAALLIDCGAVVEERVWMHVIKTGARGMLRLLESKGVLPETLTVHAALNKLPEIQSALGRRHVPGDSEWEDHEVDRAFLVACRLAHAGVAAFLLEHMTALDASLRNSVARYGTTGAFVEFLSGKPGLLWRDDRMTAWQLFVLMQLESARDGNDLATFNSWLDHESWFLGSQFVDAQSELLIPACYQKNRAAFIQAIFDRDAALLHMNALPSSTHIAQALSYGNASLIPLLSRVWPLPDDLPHAAGTGNRLAVERWFDADGRPALGALHNHYPASNPQFPRDDLHWGPPTVQQTLDVALAWAVLNHEFGIAAFLLERGANINTDWGTHEPASILHEVAIQGNREAAEFLVDRGADLTMTDYRYQSTAEGWARYGSSDLRMAEFLALAAGRHSSDAEI
ncbi:MAG: hypothetical protein ACO1Q7_06255 [Gemmatimonas sp.]